MSLFCRCGNLLSSLFPVQRRKISTFEGDFDNFSTGSLKGKPTTFPDFPHPRLLRKIPLLYQTFFLYPLYGSNLSTDFSTTCGKLFSKVLGICHTRPFSQGQPMTFVRQMNVIFCLLICHTDKLPCNSHILRDFYQIFTENFVVLNFPHEFSTECGKTCG